MTTIDAVRKPGTVLLDGATLDLLDEIGRHTARTPAEVVAVLARGSVALLTAPSVDAGASQPERPEGGPGQGEAQPPAPTNVLTPVLPTHPVAVDLADDGGVVCTLDPPGSKMHRAAWWVTGTGEACCDDHIPEGWVRPDDAPAPTNEAGPLPIYDKSEVIATPRPHVHIGFLPKGCVFGEECGR